MKYTLRTLVEGPITSIGNAIIALLFAVAFLVFVFGIFKYFFFSQSDPKARADGRAFILWGLVGLAVLFSVWGLVRLVIGILPPV